MPTLPTKQTGLRIPRNLLAALLLLAVLAAAFAFSEPAQAQEGTEYEYVDLLMAYEYDENEVGYRVHNIGTATATGVTVLFLLEDLQTDTFDSPNVTDQRTVDSTNQTFTWSVGTILPGEASNNLPFSTVNHSGHSTWDRIGVITATASSNQPEPNLLLANNVAKVYSWADSSTGATLHMSINRLALLLSVDDLEPAAGDDLNFDLTALNAGAAGRATVDDFIDLIGDIEIRVELSDGLDFKSTSDWTRPTGFTTTGRSATWKPEAVDKKGGTDFPGSREIEIQTELTSDSLDTIPLEDRCFTAWVVDSTPPPPPPADYALGSLTECLGDDPPVLFQEGSVGVLTPFPCVGVTEYPCIDSGIEVAAPVPTDPDITSFDHAAITNNLRSHGVGRRDRTAGAPYGLTILQPDSVVIHVQDPLARISDSNTNSVVSSGISWQTAREPCNAVLNLDCIYTVGGVEVTYTRKEFNNDISNWDCLIR